MPSTIRVAASQSTLQPRWTILCRPSRLLGLFGAMVFCFQMIHWNISWSGRSLRSMETNSNLPTQQRAPTKTAVVFSAIGITTACEASRLLHLVETAGMDVWVLHGFHELLESGKTQHIALSKDYIRAIPGLQRYAQTVHGYTKFDWASGSSKSSFLRFLVDHPEYDNAWLIEDDVYFTGPWNQMLSVEDDSTDFLTARISHEEGKVRDFTLGCQVLERQCTEFDRIQTGWELARVSSRLATSLLADLEQGQILGHHESVIAPYSFIKNFTYGQLDVKAQIKGNKGAALIHPYKCGDYHDTSASGGSNLSPENLLTLINAQT